jgi:hypothetical protein
MAGGHTSETVDAAISHPVISQVDRSKGKSSRPGEEPRAWRTSEWSRDNDRITLGTVSTQESRTRRRCEDRSADIGLIKPYTVKPYRVTDYRPRRSPGRRAVRSVSPGSRGGSPTPSSVAVRYNTEDR